MNRLTKLVAMKLRYKLSFVSLAQEDLKRKQQKLPSKSVSYTADLYTKTSLDDDEDFDDDVDYPKPQQLSPQRDWRYSDSESEHEDEKRAANYIELGTPITSETDIDIQSHHQAVATQSFAVELPNKKEEQITRKDIKNRMLARRKPDELRFYNLIRKQSVLTGIVALSSFTSWTLQVIYEKGSIFILTDIIINVSCVYLSVTFTKKWYKYSCCKRLEYCCHCCEDVKCCVCVDYR